MSYCVFNHGEYIFDGGIIPKDFVDQYICFLFPLVVNFIAFNKFVISIETTMPYFTRIFKSIFLPYK
ncbi:hypothetical protein PBAL39_09186 [Pedobacter sp. BAL39]|nr:hypothetical protein PBAL39_09186 [Pedobacter sp. BAL39]